MTMKFRRLTRRLRGRHCAVCDDYKRVMAGPVLQRHISCDCGRGNDPEVMHPVTCDTLPCPFCTLLREKVLA